MLAELAKYKRHLSISTQEFLAYHFSVFCSVATGISLTIAPIVFWKAVYGAGEGDIAGFSPNDMVLYMIVTSFVNGFIWVPPTVRRNIIEGEMTSHLLLPANYLLNCFFQTTGYKIWNWLSRFVLLGLLLILFLRDIELATGLWIYPSGLLALVLAYLVNFLFRFCLELLAFWTESTPPLIATLQELFGGRFVPLVFLPGALQGFADLLPFKSMLYFPSMVLVGKVSPTEFLHGLALQVLWILLLLAGIRLIWGKGVRRYAAYGG
ncbi:MAG: hypothetical protein GKR89_28770 [Candidatus Latescibacteria bacterium]|nr:hypothetical protein [Candidatus Latescibacterota bacterium]